MNYSDNESRVEPKPVPCKKRFKAPLKIRLECAFWRLVNKVKRRN